MRERTTPVVATTSRQQLVLRLGLWAGIVGPILFVLTFTIDGALTPGYSAINNAVSDLEFGANGWIQRMNFLLLGLLLMLFVVAFLQPIRPVLPPGWRRVSAALLVLAGVGFVIASLFLPAARGESPRAVHAILHTVAFTLVFLPLGVAGLLIGTPLLKTRGWRGLGWYSLVTGLLTLIPPLGNLFSFFAPAPQTPISNPGTEFSGGGLINRVGIVIAFAWIVILAIRLLLQTRGGRNAPAPA
jgi:hypothetical membrane protein